MKTKLKYEIKYPYAYNYLKVKGVEPENFHKPHISDLQNPFDFENMQEVVKIIDRYKGRKTLSVVDCDNDGYCAASILANYLKDAYPEYKLETIFHEHKEHGLKDIDKRVELSEYDLVFVTDAGSMDDEIYKEHPNVQFIILDHHDREYDYPLPNNTIIVNNQLERKYRNKALSGAGVVWQTCRAIDMQNGTSYADKLIDLAAIAIISDVMNVTTPENHYIIDTGLSSVSNFFLRLLWQNAEYKIGTQLTSIGVAFYITPLINAITRVGTLEEKERLYLAFTDPHSLVESHKRGSDGALAKVAVESLRECTNAKARQDRIKKKGLELCDKKIIENDLIEDSLIFIELDEEFDFVPPELNGVIASAVTSKYNRPVLIGRDNGKEIKGSIRSIDTLDMMPLKEFLLESGYMEWVQGHSLAAGFCISNSKTDNLLDWSNKQLKNIDLDTSVWEVDFSLDEETEYNNIYDLIYDLDTYKKYWGKGLEEPLIHVKNIEISLDNVFVLGTKGDTVKIISNGVSYMFFKKTPAEVKEFLANPIMNIEIVGTGNLNVFRGNYTPQITVSDYNITPIALW